MIITLSGFFALWVAGLQTVLSIFSMGAVSWLAFAEHGLLFDPVYPGISLFLLFVFSSLLSYWRLSVDKQQIKAAFGHYISPVFMEELTKNPDKLKLGGETKDLTDIRNFTKISEALDPQTLIQLMNDFLTPMSDLVMGSRGTIDKYMGDAMMAFWNAPLDDLDHARQACFTALRMDEALKPVNVALKEKGLGLTLQVGIGINTGPCSVGNMGSKQRFAYSALGDAVNLASRLEGQTKQYGVTNLIGEDTVKAAKDLTFLELDLIQVVGKEKPVKIYTLLGDEKLKDNKEFQIWQAAHNTLLASYRTGDLSCAAQDCKEAQDLAEDKLQAYYKLMMERIIDFTKNGLPENWQGVFKASQK